MVNTDSTTSSIITSDSLPAILMGGAPHAGKSTLTYNLTRELRRCEIPHYVFRANPDNEGDWFLKGDIETVRQIRVKGNWSDIFREFVCRDLAQRYLPLIVDLGGLPREADTCIFQVCTHSILLLKGEDEKVTQTWRHFSTTNNLRPLAEFRSQLEGKSILTAEKPPITGTLTTGLKQGERIRGTVFNALLEQVIELFSIYSPAELEKFHLDAAPKAFIVNLPQQLHGLPSDTSDTDEWTPNMLQPLLAQLPAPTAMAVYGRAPTWVYGALALHAGTQAYHQFDARLGWVTPPMLQVSTSGQSPQSPIDVEEKNNNNGYVIRIHPIHSYIDYREADQLAFPEPPPNRGVIVTGKLPLWLFTALSRFYVQRDVPWIALNDAHDNRPVVIYSQVASHPIGTILPAL